MPQVDGRTGAIPHHREAEDLNSRLIRLSVWIIKGKRAQVGEIRNWKNGRFQKQSDGWKRIGGKEQGASPDESAGEEPGHDPYKTLQVRTGTTEVQKELGRTLLSDLRRQAERRSRRAGAEPGHVKLVATHLPDMLSRAGTVALTGQTVRHAADLANIAQIYRDPRMETFRVIYLKNDRVIAEKSCSSRLPGAVRVDPESMQAALDYRSLNADSFYVLHNHPSGNPAPSRMDLNFTEHVTRELKRLYPDGPEDAFRGHVIVDHNRYAFIPPDGLWETHELRKELHTPPLTPALPHPMLGRRIDSPADFASLAKQFLGSDFLKSAPVLIATTKDVTGLVSSLSLGMLPENDGPKSARFRAWLRGLLRAAGTGNFRVLCVSDADFSSTRHWAAFRYCIRAGILTDVVGESGGSLRHLVRPGPEDLLRAANPARLKSTLPMSPLPLVKGRAATLGEIRTWKNGRFQKQANGWKRIRDESHEEPAKADHASNSSDPGHHHTLALTFLPARDIVEREQYTAKKDYDRATIDGIKESIRTTGYNPAFPLQVDVDDAGRHTIVSGHHRYTAVRELIEEKGLPHDFHIPVIVQQYSGEQDRLMAQIAENVRRTVKPTDEARAFGRLVEMGVTPSEIAKHVGKDNGAVLRRLALNNLSKELLHLAEKGSRSLPLGIAEAIGMHGLRDDGTPDGELQMRALLFYRENRPRGYRAGEVISYINEMKSRQKMKLFDNDGKSPIEQEALRSVGSAERAKRNVKLLDGFLHSLTAGFHRLFGDSIHDLKPDLVKELSASLVAATGEGGFGKKMRELDAVISDLNAVKRSLERAYSHLQLEGDTPAMFAMAKSIRWLDVSEKNGKRILKSLLESYRDAPHSPDSALCDRTAS